MTHAFGRDIAFSFDARPRPKRHSSWLICVLLALHGCGGGSSSSQGSASSVNASSGATAGAMSAQTGNGTVASGPNNASDTPIPDIPSSAPPTPAPYASGQPMGKWSALHDWPQVAINLTLLPDGKVLSWANEAVDDHRAGMSGRVYIADIRNDGAPASFTAVHNTTTNLFCSGMTFLPDGRLLVAGGETSDYTGSAHANIFDFRNYSWQRIANMNRGRWYPTTTSLASGEVLVLGGWDDTEGTGTNTLPQVWRVEGGWRDLTGALFDVGAYPRMHLAPGGRVFGTFQNTGGSRYLDTSGTGAWADAAPPRFPFPRDYGSSVMYDEGKVIVMGGAMDPPTETAEIIDLNAAAPAWEWTGSMKHRRRQINATIMADGNVLVTGGTSTPGWNDAADAVLPAEMWNPRTGQWTTMASMNVPRLYHSTAVLLPDGRVLSAGGGAPAPVNGTSNYTVEFFSPPYLFNGARPTITNAPASVQYGQKFFVQTPDAAEVVKATWVRLSSVTHAFNMNQRISHLAVAKTGAGVYMAAPRDPNLTPPGHYMLFLINGRGVPSIAKIVQIM